MLLESYVKVIDVLGLFFDMLSMGFRTTRQSQTSGRLVQEVNGCTVLVLAQGWYHMVLLSLMASISHTRTESSIQLVR